jgi:hypothetical protein
MESTQPASNILGRGGASLTLISSTETNHTLLLVFGASREQQFDDFWSIQIDRKTFKVGECRKLDVKERDDFTTRNSMGAVYLKEKNQVVFFGGMDSE